MITNPAPLQLIITGLRELTPRIRAYKLSASDGTDLPLAGAGSHLAIPVETARGNSTRQYSICSNPLQRQYYEIAVLLESQGDGGSSYIHEHFTEGMQLLVEPPANHFPLHPDSSPALLIAAGIGITPIKAMAHTLALRGRRFQLHYAGRSESEMAFLPELQHDFAQQLRIYPSDKGMRMDLMAVLANATSNTQFYCCGPQSLLKDYENFAGALGIEKDRLHSERFHADTFAGDKPVILELARSNKILQVAADQSLLAAVRAAGVPVNFDCCVGDCGSCAVTVLDGEPDHRDHVQSDAAKTNGRMCLCVSRAKGEKLILDL